MTVEELLILGAMIVLAVPVAVVFLLIHAVRTRDRLRALEAQVQALRQGLATGAAPVAAPVPEAGPPAEAAPATQPEPAPAGPWTRRPAAEAAPEAAYAPPQDGPIVLRAERASAFARWLRENWVYAVSAVSLALAGIFLVQYGVETGLLSPAVRVAMALGLGAALVTAGEWLRRRFGDREGVATAYLPSTFSGAGIVSMFAGILAARQLYGLIGVEVALAGLVAVAALAILLGWFHGPFLAAAGLLGAAAAPFAVGGEAQSPYWLFAYFWLVAFTGLAVDAVRRWAWISVLALALGFGGGWLVVLGSAGGAGWFAMMNVAIILAAIAVPVLSVTPAHDGPMTAEAIARPAGGWPGFPTRLASGAMIAGALSIHAAPVQVAADAWVAYGGLALLVVAVALWAERARALADLAIVPAVLFLARLLIDGIDGSLLLSQHLAGAIPLRAPETAAPMIVPGLLLLAAVISLAAALRSLRGTEYPALWAAGAALVAPVAALILELFWAPRLVLGAYPWALMVIALAGGMVLLAERFARRDGEDRRRMAHAVLSALSLVALALFLLLTEAALTVALAALVVAAAALDRRFRLPEMGLFLFAGAVTLSWRLAVDPGLYWSVEVATLWEVILAHGAAAAGFAAARLLLAPLDRPRAHVTAEAGLALALALLANALLARWVQAAFEGEALFSHWSLSLAALPWLIVALVQLYQTRLPGSLRWVHWTLAVVAGGVAALGIGLAVTLANPLSPWSEPVLGPLLLDTMVLAYLLPGAVILAALARLGHLSWLLRRGLTVGGIALCVLWAGLEIRRFWRGEAISAPGVTQPELYTYTLALLLAGAVLLYQALARRSVGLRRIAMAVIGVTVAKVFLIDASGLTGLTRVFSFLALGLALAGLAWLNRWAAVRQGEGPA